MLFQPTPKKRKQDLFARRSDIDNLEKSISTKQPLVIITGTRRVGKTSLVMAVLNEMEGKFIHIDTRSLSSKDSISKEEAIGIIQSGLQEFLDNNSRLGKIEKLRPFLTAIKGITFADFGVALDLTTTNTSDIRVLFKRLDEWAKNNGRLVISIDEAQNFAKVIDIDLTGLLAYIYDNCESITIILTGSEIGLLYDFLAFEKPQTPLYGRFRYDLKLNPLKAADSKAFLVEGFKQLGWQKQVSEQNEILERAVLNLDGIVGWLVMFANKCIVNGAISDNPIFETQKEGSVLARWEFDRFLSTKTNRKELLEVMEDAARLNFSEFIIKNVDDKIKLPAVQALIEEEFLTLTEGRYIITDPLLAFSFSVS